MTLLFWRRRNGIVIQGVGRRLLVIVAGMAMMVLVSCTPVGNKKNNAETLFEKQDFIMGTLVIQRVYGDHASVASEAVTKRLMDIENRMTISKTGGEINAVNDMAGIKATQVSEDTFEVLKKAKEYAVLSQGTFDITIGPLVKAWGVFTENPRIPEKSEIERLRALVGYQSLILDAPAKTAHLEKKGQIIDLGAIAKGFGADEAVRIYKEHGITSAYVFLGGNVLVLGTKPDGTPWRIGIQNPRAYNGSYVGIIEAQDKAVVTSGDYERFFEKDGRRYHHIVDPATGYPSDSGLISTTIIADRSMDADALSTATFVMGVEKGMALINQLGGVEAVFITEEKEIVMSEGLKDNFVLEDETNEYTLAEKR